MRYKLAIFFLLSTAAAFSQSPSNGYPQVVKRTPDTAESYDPALKTPDIDAMGMSHGYFLTPLGCLLFSPYAYALPDLGYNVQLYHKGKEISSVGYPYAEWQKDIVFEFQRDGTLKYWFKHDYLSPALDTIKRPDGSTIVSHSIHPSSKLPLKNIYTTGSWKADFKKHILKIDFGPNYFSLIPLEGKYLSLGAGRIEFQQEQMLDSLVNGKKIRFKKVINSYFEFF